MIQETTPRMPVESIVKVEHHFGPGIYIKEMHIPAGYVIGTHSHKYDHFSILAKGTVKVEVDGIVTDYDAPYILNIEKRKEHRVFAATDTVWLCTHATDEDNKDEIDDTLIEKDLAV